MIKIYHNPRCSKSRQGLNFLESTGEDFIVVKYLDEAPTTKELSGILKKLNIAPIDLVRKQEKIWTDNYRGKELSDKEIIDVMVENPILIERPIVVNGSKAAIGRPLENIENIIR